MILKLFIYVHLFHTKIVNICKTLHSLYSVETGIFNVFTAKQVFIFTKLYLKASFVCLEPLRIQKITFAKCLRQIGVSLTSEAEKSPIAITPSFETYLFVTREAASVTFVMSCHILTTSLFARELITLAKK